MVTGLPGEGWGSQLERGKGQRENPARGHAGFSPRPERSSGNMEMITEPQKGLICSYIPYDSRPLQS